MVPILVWEVPIVGSRITLAAMVMLGAVVLGGFIGRDGQSADRADSGREHLYLIRIQFGDEICIQPITATSHEQAVQFAEVGYAGCWGHDSVKSIEWVQVSDETPRSFQEAFKGMLGL